MLLCLVYLHINDFRRPSLVVLLTLFYVYQSPIMYFLFPNMMIQNLSHHTIGRNNSQKLIITRYIPEIACYIPKNVINIRIRYIIIVISTLMAYFKATIWIFYSLNRPFKYLNAAFSSSSGGFWKLRPAPKVEN